MLLLRRAETPLGCELWGVSVEGQAVGGQRSTTHRFPVTYD
jgi:hypothetical protein